MDVHTPRSVDEALRLKAELPEARFVQGGTDVLVELNFDRSRRSSPGRSTRQMPFRTWSLPRARPSTTFVARPRTAVTRGACWRGAGWRGASHEP